MHLVDAIYLGRTRELSLGIMITRGKTPLSPGDEPGSAVACTRLKMCLPIRPSVHPLFFHLLIYLYVYLSIYLSIYPSLFSIYIFTHLHNVSSYQSTCLLIRLPGCLSICMFVGLCICKLFVQSDCRFTHQLIHFSFYPFVCLLVCRSVSSHRCSLLS